jgi:hypothetical protein
VRPPRPYETTNALTICYYYESPAADLRILRRRAHRGGHTRGNPHFRPRRVARTEKEGEEGGDGETNPHLARRGAEPSKQLRAVAESRGTGEGGSGVEYARRRGRKKASLQWGAGTCGSLSVAGGAWRRWRGTGRGTGVIREGGARGFGVSQRFRMELSGVVCWGFS